MWLGVQDIFSCVWSNLNITAVMDRFVANSTLPNILLSAYISLDITLNNVLKKCVIQVVLSITIQIQIWILKNFGKQIWTTFTLGSKLEFSFNFCGRHSIIFFISRQQLGIGVSKVNYNFYGTTTRESVCTVYIPIWWYLLR